MGRRERIQAIAATYYGRERNVWKLQMNAVYKGLQKQYYNRRTKKRDIRKQWIQQINAGTREHGVSYGVFINCLIQDKILINRKMLANLAQQEPLSFRALVEQVRERIMERRAEELREYIEIQKQKTEREDLHREWLLRKDRQKKIDIEALIKEREKEIVQRATVYPEMTPTTPKERQVKKLYTKSTLKKELEVERL